MKIQLTYPTLPTLGFPEPPAIPVDAIRRWIDACANDPDVEGVLIDYLVRILEKTEFAGATLFYAIVIAGAAKSERSIPALMALYNVPESDILYDLADWALIQIGPPAARAVMKWIETEPPWEVRMCGYTILEHAPDYAVSPLKEEIIHFLKRRVKIEESSKDKIALFEAALSGLSRFRDEDTVEFIREMVDRYDFNPELAEALEVADGRFPYPLEWLSRQSWEDVCRQYVDMAFRDDPDCDPPDLLEMGAKCKAEGKIDEAEKYFMQMSRAQPRRWDGPHKLAILYSETGDAVRASVQIREAVLRAQRSWEISSRVLDYEVVEMVEQDADRILGRPVENVLSRWRNYVFGALIETGAAEFGEIYDYLSDMVEPQSSPAKDALFQSLKSDARFKVYWTAAALSDVDDVGRILTLRKSKDLTLYLHHSLSGLQRLAEGRARDMYDRRDMQMDQDIVILTRARLNLDSVRRVIRRDIDGMIHTNRMIARAISVTKDPQRLTELLMNEVWNRTSRWELGGRSPNEVLEKYPEREQFKEARVSLTEFQIPGRNDPCPCGSGKKYKKCCMPKQTK